MTAQVSVDEQMRVLMRGVEYGDPNIQRTMEEDLRERLSLGKPLRVYCGFDPTSTDLTLGNMVPMLKMRQFQRLGHDVTFLIGTMTGLVGDPSDKTAARQMLTVEQVESNAQTWLRQVFRVLDPDKTTIERNGDWLASLTLAEVVQLASNFTVAQFLEHETFRNRMAEAKPLYIHEFIYALMQAYDAHHLKTDVQLGAVDQLFNIMAGRQLQRALGERPLIAVTTPLLKGTDGVLKMSKSVGNYVGLDEAPAEMYGKLMSIPDSLMPNYFTLLTEVPSEELAEIERGLAAKTLNPMEAKKRLARSVVALLYDDGQAEAAQAEFERVFQRREEPEEAQELPLALDQDGKASVDITLALSVAGVAGSRSEARRLLQQGGISIDGQPIKEAQVELAEGSLIRVGRHRFLRVVAADG
ncbi:MAG: tyrosine--tRNA ligase [Dehalococcoidia bacterium]|nr:tyrosine--tRNA ligase [Dehalococcoidia bacterium]